MLRGRKILLGVCGSIAAYKTATLVRLLKKSGAEVKVIMTASAQTFITPLTLSTLSDNPVYTQFEKDDTGEWNSHVELGLWADLFLIAPVTATSLGKLSNGIADNLLNAVYLSARCPVVFAPAMDLDMYQHESVKTAITKLKSFGNQFIDSEYGELASGLIGEGRMAEPEHLLAYIEDFFNKAGQLKGKKVLITAGPTYEAIDPVRFIGNHSSGKMGLALAKKARAEGADVTLIIGPNSLASDEFEGLIKIDVVSAKEMYDAAKVAFSESDIVFWAAAVADYTPSQFSEQKIKKSNLEISLALSKTTDIALTLDGEKESQFIVGFALETEEEVNNAKEKLQKKNLDLIVLNSLNDKGAGFKHDSNKITIIDKDNNTLEFELKSKEEVAKDIIDEVAKRIS
jgi:phosphopantothenoylcysteine decarboxylase/phosphopantothenate--cysteine ligase